MCEMHDSLHSGHIGVTETRKAIDSWPPLKDDVAPHVQVVSITSLATRACWFDTAVTCAETEEG